MIKGKEDNPNYTSRLAGKEFNVDQQIGLFAATPPPEAFKLLIGEAATFGYGEEENKVIMINDVSRAFFEAPMKREMCVEIPEEDREEGEGDMVGLLNMSLYGTRDTAVIFSKRSGR